MFDLKAKNLKEAIVIYLQILYKFHKLTDTEILLLADIIHKYKELESKYDKDIAMKLYLDKDNRDDIKARLNMKDQVFRNYLTTYRKKGIIKESGLDRIFDLNINDIKIEFSINYER